MIHSVGKKPYSEAANPLQTPATLDMSSLLHSLENIALRLERLESQNTPGPQSYRRPYNQPQKASPEFRPRNQSGRVVGPCYKCGQYGHLQRSCHLLPPHLPNPVVKPPTPPPPTETPINFSLSPASPTLTVPFVSGFVDSVPMQILIDSGAAISLLRYDALPQSVHLQILRPPDTVLAVSASGHSLDVVGKVMLPLHLKDVCITHEFTVVRKLAVDALLGIDFLTSSGAIVDCSKVTSVLQQQLFHLYPHIIL